MSKIKLGFRFLFTLTFAKIWNSFLIRLGYLFSKLFREYFHWGRPESLSIEPTNLCNLKCPECPSGNNKMLRSRLFLSEADFKSTIDQTYKHLVYLQLYFQGEPFMHPKLNTFIKYATQKNIFTSTSTNGHFLTTKTCNEIVESGLHQIIVSIDGASQETYERYRVGGSLDKVIEGIKNLNQAKKYRKTLLPHIVVQFVVFSSNEHELDAIKGICKDLKISDLRVKSAQIDNYANGNALMPKNNHYNRYVKGNDGIYRLKRKNNFKCFRVWNGAVISSNNELLPCCFDKDANYPFNSSANYVVNTAWKNEKAKAFRKKVWQDNKKFEMCQNCTEGIKRTWF